MAPDPAALAKPTRAMLYEVLTPTERFAVQRELLLDRSVKTAKVYNTENAFLDGLCSELYPQFEATDDPQTVQHVGNLFMHEFTHNRIAAAWPGFKWNQVQLKYERRGNSTGQRVKQVDQDAKLAEAAEKAERKRALVALDDAVQTERAISRKNKSKKPRNAFSNQ